VAGSSDMNRPIAFRSCLAEALEQFVACKRLQGYDYTDQAPTLGYFARFLAASRPCQRARPGHQHHRQLQRRHKAADRLRPRALRHRPADRRTGPEGGPRLPLPPRPNRHSPPPYSPPAPSCRVGLGVAAQAYPAGLHSEVVLRQSHGCVRRSWRSSKAAISRGPKRRGRR
jgi:hypothetical protein